jgi:hypothetical protein
MGFGARQLCGPGYRVLPRPQEDLGSESSGLVSIDALRTVHELGSVKVQLLFCNSLCTGIRVPRAGQLGGLGYGASLGPRPDSGSEGWFLVFV